MKRSSIITVGALAAAIILVPTVASASNGGAWLLGRSNTESATTTVTNSAGTPLSLNSKSGTPPMTVNRSTKVTNLNSDLVDGYSATAFAMRSAKSGIVYGDGYADLDGDGVADLTGAKCPTGTIIAGGGGFDPLGSPIGYSGPDFTSTGALIANSWLVMDPSGGPMVSFANCIQMSGAAVPGAVTNMSSIPVALAPAQGVAPQGSVPDSLLKMRADAKGTTKVAK